MATGGGALVRGGGGGASSRKWALELGEASLNVTRDIMDPPGFSRVAADLDESSSRAIKSKEMEPSWKQQKAWEAASAPVKNLLMMAFMLWMAGSTVHIFSLGIVFSALWQPLTALRSVGKMFEPFDDPRIDTFLPKLAFVCLNMAALGVGLAKLNSLGLLPTHASDWVSSLPPRQVLEFSGGGVPY